MMRMLVGRYQFVEHLGKGGFGVVEKYYDVATDEFVAVKTVPALCVNKESKRLIREVDILSFLHDAHPHVIGYFNMFVTTPPHSDGGGSSNGNGNAGHGWENDSFTQSPEDVPEDLNMCGTHYANMSIDEKLIRHHERLRERAARVVCTHDFNLHIVMPLMKGDLLTFINLAAPESLERAQQGLALEFMAQVSVVFAFQICFGLDFLHRCSIFHRDIKPDNVLIRVDTSNAYMCTALITDLGLARDAQESDTFYICTRYYRPPEMIMNSAKGCAAVDVWSLGCVFYELCTGQVLLKIRSALRDGMWDGAKASNQLEEVLNTLGTPTHAEIHRYMTDSNAKLYLLRSRPRSSQLSSLLLQNWRLQVSSEERALWIDLITCCLGFFPQQRPSAQELCCHPLFRRYRILYGENVKQYPARAYLPTYADTALTNSLQADNKAIILELVQHALTQSMPDLSDDDVYENSFDTGTPHASHHPTDQSLTSQVNQTDEQHEQQEHQQNHSGIACTNSSMEHHKENSDTQSRDAVHPASRRVHLDDDGEDDEEAERAEERVTATHAMHAEVSAQLGAAISHSMNSRIDRNNSSVSDGVRDAETAFLRPTVGDEIPSGSERVERRRGMDSSGVVAAPSAVHCDPHNAVEEGKEVMEVLVVKGGGYSHDETSGSPVPPTAALGHACTPHKRNARSDGPGRWQDSWTSLPLAASANEVARVVNGENHTNSNSNSNSNNNNNNYYHSDNSRYHPYPTMHERHHMYNDDSLHHHLLNNSSSMYSNDDNSHMHRNHNNDGDGGCIRSSSDDVHAHAVAHPSMVHNNNNNNHNNSSSNPSVNWTGYGVPRSMRMEAASVSWPSSEATLPSVSATNLPADVSCMAISQAPCYPSRLAGRVDAQTLPDSLVWSHDGRCAHTRAVDPRSADGAHNENDDEDEDEDEDEEMKMDREGHGHRAVCRTSGRTADGYTDHPPRNNAGNDRPYARNHARREDSQTLPRYHGVGADVNVSWTSSGMHVSQSADKAAPLSTAHALPRPLYPLSREVYGTTSAHPHLCYPASAAATGASATATASASVSAAAPVYDARGVVPMPARLYSSNIHTSYQSYNNTSNNNTSNSNSNNSSQQPSQPDDHYDTAMYNNGKHPSYRNDSNSDNYNHNSNSNNNNNNMSINNNNHHYSRNNTSNSNISTLSRSHTSNNGGAVYPTHGQETSYRVNSERYNPASHSNANMMYTQSTQAGYPAHASAHPNPSSSMSYPAVRVAPRGPAADSDASRGGGAESMPSTRKEPTTVAVAAPVMPTLQDAEMRARYTALAQTRAGVQTAIASILVEMERYRRDPVRSRELRELLCYFNRVE